MKTYIILLRGVNVGGKNLLPMKELKKVLEGAGFEQVKTYIQSGNIVLLSDSNPETEISGLIQAEFGFTPQILVLENDEFTGCVANNPYQALEGKSVHFYFCKTKPQINEEKLAALISATESYQLVEKVFYLHAPDGIGRSKLVANIEACLGVAATGRNLNTVNKLTDMVKNT
ncbi:DUF1697 domain-containing protein [Thalassomonas actiniarum]|uniref:DUF1697 domain-containing protein n=1 Tax=Thalassomonas actiniarum TaxID=485447 RepID=A0AAE9YVS3_9GAMM|nr:DUF1697 domain-containing protein [Thalassomonas actiniarum]WDE01250.1 DUF1697 domain-containing protein [Thalassomonas actiniarum]